MQPFPPLITNRYRDLEQLGSGAMGTVYRAVDGELRRPVAIKTLTPDSKLQPDMRIRLAREARYLATVSHPNVVAVLDLIDDDGQLFLIMEYVDGITLHDALRISHLTVGQRVAIIAALAEGLAAVHAAGILHRDIKPANVILTADNVPKLADFGLGRLLDGDQTAITREGYLVGTLGYVAPEVIYGDSPSVVSDVYQLGVVAYETLTGVHPVSSLEFNRYLKGLPPMRFVPPSSRNPSVDGTLDGIVERAMEPDPERRTPSAARMHDQLSKWVSDNDTTSTAVLRPALVSGVSPVRRSESEGLESGVREVDNGRPGDRAQKANSDSPAPPTSAVFSRGLLVIVIIIAFTALTLRFHAGSSDDLLVLGDMVLETRPRGLQLDFTTASPTSLSLRIIDPTTVDPVFRCDDGAPQSNHSFTVSGLSPDSDYIVQIVGRRDMWSRSFRTPLPELIAPVRILRRAEFLYVDAPVDHPTPLQLEILAGDEFVLQSTMMSTPHVSTIPDSLIEGPDPLRWTISCGSVVLADGRLHELRAHVPGGDETLRAAGAGVHLAPYTIMPTRRGTILFLQPDSAPGGFAIRHSLPVLDPLPSRTINYGPVPLLIESDEVHGLLLTSAPRQWWLWSARTHPAPAVTARPLEVSESFLPTHLSVGPDGSLVVASGGTDLTIATINRARGTLVGTVTLPRPSFVPPRSTPGSILVRDLGVSPVHDRGIGLLAPPFYHDDHLVTAVAVATNPFGSEVLAHLAVLTAGTPPRLTQTMDPFPVPPAAARWSPRPDGRLALASGDRLILLDPRRGTLAGTASLPEEPNAISYVAGALTSRGDTTYGLHFQGGQAAAQRAIVGAHGVSLVSFDPAGTPTVHSPPLFQEFAGDQQAAAAQRMLVVDDRYLVALTRMNLAVIELHSGRAGSIFLGALVAEGITVTPEGDLFIVGHRKGYVMSVPIAAVKALNQRQLVGIPG